MKYILLKNLKFQKDEFKINKLDVVQLVKDIIKKRNKVIKFCFKEVVTHIGHVAQIYMLLV